MSIVGEHDSAGTLCAARTGRPANIGPTHQPRMRALLIGINYFGQRGELTNCTDHAKNMFTYLQCSINFPRASTVVLTDDQHNPYSQPSLGNIIRALHWLVKDVQPDDKLYFYYCGHGGNLLEADPTNDGDDIEDCLYPADFRSAGVITREELDRIVVKALPRGVRLTEIIDTCHPSPMHGISCPRRNCIVGQDIFGTGGNDSSAPAAGGNGGGGRTAITTNIYQGAALSADCNNTGNAWVAGPCREVGGHHAMRAPMDMPNSLCPM